MSTSPPVRIPKNDFREIKEIQRKLDCNFNYAFKKWKQIKMGIKWENY